MPCPYFFPDAPRQETQWFRPPRSPLGVLHHGHCYADAAHEPVEALCCNVGYARGTCSRFPESAEVDAVRFARTAGGFLCILEKDHRPLRHMTVEEVTDPVLVAQAQAFAGDRSNATLLGE